MRRLLLLLAACASLGTYGTGCGKSNGGSAAASGVGARKPCADTAGFSCANAANEAILPILAQDGVKPTLASDEELCRRLYVDLSGAIPSWDEYQSHCAGKQAGDIVDYLMAQPAYVAVNQRLWADSFQYDNSRSWYQYLTDLDAQVGKLYRGELSYPDFAAIAVTHPAFITEFVGENVIAYAFLAFLGRDALPEERQDLLGLYRMWRTMGASDPALGNFKYGPCTTDANCDPGRVCSNMQCIDPNNYREIVVDPTRCAGPVGTIACTSVAHGITVQLAGTQPITLDQLTPDQWKTLRAPGALLATLPGFDETAVDAVLKKYTGWWHGGFQLPGYDVPEVRAALTAFFKSKNSDIRALEREVLTSALYTMSAVQGDMTDPKYWHRGPTKQMLPEAWLDSVGKLAGVKLGSCDWRFPNTSTRWLPPALVPAPSDLASFGYTSEARIMGGCPDNVSQQRQTSVGVLYAMEQRSILANVCTSSKSTAFLPASGATPASLVTSLWQSAFTHTPKPDELTPVASTLPAADATTARNLCQALLRTNPFLFY